MSPVFQIRCRASSRVIELAVAGAAMAGAVTISTTFGILRWQGAVPAAGAVNVTIARPASDVGFDWIAYSRGRFAIESGSTSRLVVPVVGEIAHVVEDCRN
jgi:hypothetical protein